MKTSFLWIHPPFFQPVLTLLWACCFTAACSESSHYLPADTETSSVTSTEEDTSCKQILKVTVRDFTEKHPDFEREDEGWGPARGLIKEYLSPDRKPVFNLLRGECKLHPKTELCEPTQSWSNTPMWGENIGGKWNAEETFNTWYRDNDEIDFPLDWYEGNVVNHTQEVVLTLKPNPNARNSFIYKSNAFFPLSADEGFGESPIGSGENYLFTTEIHTAFEYVENQIFSFSGDDDLWIFVNGKLALDLGGLHVPFDGQINFDALAADLGIAPGGRYNMDIFHAERHTDQSNFEIETNISCFLPVVVE